MSVQFSSLVSTSSSFPPPPFPPCVSFLIPVQLWRPLFPSRKRWATSSDDNSPTESVLPQAKRSRYVIKSLLWYSGTPSRVDTIGSNNFVRYSEVSLTQRLLVGVVLYYRAVEHNVGTFSEFFLAVRWQGRLSRGY